MNDLLSANPDPDDGRYPLRLDPVNLPGDSVLTVVGQDEAVRSLRAVLLRYKLAISANALDKVARLPTCLAGPVGVGKRTSLLAVAKQLDLPVASVDLLEAGSKDLPRLVVRALRGEMGDEITHPAVVFIRNLESSPPESLASLARLISTPGVLEYGLAGRRLHVDLGAIQFAYSVGGVLAASESGMHLLTACPMPLGLGLATGVVIPFRELSRTDLFAILAVGEASPLQRMLRAFEQVTGCEPVSVSENAIYELVDEAIANYPTMGALGLEKVLRAFEIRLYAGLNPKEY